MGDWRLLDNEDGVKSWHKLEDGKTIIKTTQDVQPIFDLNQTARSNQTSGWKGDMHEVAAIPFVVYTQILKSLGHDWKQPITPEIKVKLYKLLSSSEYAKLRTKEGRLA